MLGDDLSRDIWLFFKTDSYHQRQNETHVCLIPKVVGPKNISEYGPISLCNVYYKIIAKILSKRLHPLLFNLISEHQSTFFPARAISDNVLITHEIIYYLRTSGATKQCSMAIKTDMSKAYDRIEWYFLRKVLHRLVFHHKWVAWVMQCVCSVSYSFVINGSLKGKVVPSRGLRQGDPLSPYLFILYTEMLSGLFHRAQENGTLAGIKVSRGGPPVNHLLFADDSMFFCKTNATCCSSLVDILSRYEKASG